MFPIKGIVTDFFQEIELDVLGLTNLLDFFPKTVYTIYSQRRTEYGKSWYLV